MKSKSEIATLVLVSILLTIFTVTPVASQEEKPGPFLDDYYAVIIPDPYAQVAALRADEVQGIEVPDYETALALEEEGFYVHTTVSSTVYMYDINVNGSAHPDPTIAAKHGFPLNNRNFRRAISYLTGVDELLATSPLLRGMAVRNRGWDTQLGGIWYNGPDSPALEKWPELSEWLAEEFPFSTDSAIHEMFLGDFVPIDGAGNPISEADAKADPAAIDHWEYDGTPMRTIEVSTSTTWGGTYIDMADVWAAGLESIGIHTTKAYAAGSIYWPKIWSGDYDIGIMDTAWSKPDPIIMTLYFASWRMYWDLETGEPVYGCCNWRFWNDTEADQWINTYSTTLDLFEAVEAAWKLQWKVAKEAITPAAFTWLEYTAFHPDLVGFRKTRMIADRGLGSIRMRWATDSAREAHDNAVKIAWSVEPLELNPATQINVPDTYILEGVTGGYGGGLGVTLQDPVTQEQKPWIAEDWQVESFTKKDGTTGTKITYWLRDDVYWHDGVQFTADDLKFSLEYGRDYGSDFQGQSAIATRDLLNVTVTDVDGDGWNEAVVYEGRTSPYYLSYIGFFGSMIPKHIWEGVPDPTAITPWTMDNPNPEAAAIGLTYVVGNGPWVYHKGDWASGEYIHLRAARGANVLSPGEFFRSAENSIADINLDFTIDIRDITTAAMAFGSYPGHPRWEPRADVNWDRKVDIRDITTIAMKFGKTW